MFVVKMNESLSRLYLCAYITLLKSIFTEEIDGDTVMVFDDYIPVKRNIELCALFLEPPGYVQKMVCILCMSLYELIDVLFLFM